MRWWEWMLFIAIIIHEKEIQSNIKIFLLTSLEVEWHSFSSKVQKNTWIYIPSFVYNSRSSKTAAKWTGKVINRWNVSPLFWSPTRRHFPKAHQQSIWDIPRDWFPKTIAKEAEKNSTNISYSFLYIFVLKEGKQVVKWGKKFSLHYIRFCLFVRCCCCEILWIKSSRVGIK